MKSFIVRLFVVVACFTAPVEAVIIDTVFVGNAGNLGDTRYPREYILSFGGVAYNYSMGKYEVTAGQYTEFLNAVAATDTHDLYDMNMGNISDSVQGANVQRSGSPGSYAYSVAPDWADRPINYVDWGDVARFANWMHNGQPSGLQGLNTTEDGSYYLSADLMSVVRKPNATWVIPTEDEWYKTAYHKNNGLMGGYWNWPTGTNTNPSEQLINPDPGNNANFTRFFGGYYTIGSPYFRTVVGEFENSESPYGTFDQGGNVAEWNETIVSGRGLRGGSFIYYDLFSLHASNGMGDYPVNEDQSLGFRLAKVPEPSSLFLLSFGALAMIRRRR